MESKKEIEALINLLEDPDKKIFEEVSRNLLDRGLSIIPELEEAWEKSSSQFQQEKIENLIQQIQINYTREELQAWIRNGASDLLEGAYFVAKYQYPDLEISQLENQIEIIRKDVWLELNENLTALEKVKVLNQIIFKMYGLKRNSAQFYAPQNNYLNIVLETKKGNPISLSIIYSIVAQRLGLPVFGVNLPRNFILVYMDEHKSKETYDEELNANILFYINPFNYGSVLGRKEIDHFIKQQNLTPQRSFYIPCSNTDIIHRLLLNLSFAYEQAGNENKVNNLKGLLEIFGDRSTEI